MRPRRRIEFERIMGRKAWTAQELAVRLGMHPTTCRMYLRRYYNLRILDRVKFGAFMYYAVARFLHLPDGSYPCPLCGGRMNVYHCKCGCVFQLCLIDNLHSRFEYCSRHRADVRKTTRR